MENTLDDRRGHDPASDKVRFRK